MTTKSCGLCTHLCWELETPDLSELTPGSDASLGCPITAVDLSTGDVSVINQADDQYGKAARVLESALQIARILKIKHNTFEAKNIRDYFRIAEHCPLYEEESR